MLERDVENAIWAARQEIDFISLSFVRSPDGISIEILQEGESLPAQEPWISMENSGTW